MKLVRARVTNYRSIDDSGWVDFEDITCLVGKNESGKTAFLQALSRLNPVAGGRADYDPVMDYPSKDYGKYRKRHDDDPDTVVDAEFELSDAELAAIEEQLGQGVLTGGKTLRWTKGYDNRPMWMFQTDAKKATEHLLTAANLPAAVKAEAKDLNNPEALLEFLQGLTEPTEQSTEVIATIESWPGNNFRRKIATRLGYCAPRFLYFDDYSVMRGRVSVEWLKARIEAEETDERDRTFLAFLALGGADLSDFQDETNFERLTRELEAAANAIGSEVFEYWTQNKKLRVNVQVSAANPDDDPPLDTGTILNVRIFNERHGVTVPFDERSRGFVWFFSFLAYFSDLDAKPRELVLLLDEPGLSLHAKAQDDFLRLIEERLGPDFQTIYTTHSPFLIDAARLERVRTVQDVDGKGTLVSPDVYKTDSDTVFPLQAALGYDLAQTLFLGPDCLLVEGPSDLIYLQVLGEAVIAAGGDPLDPRWVVIPVGGADKLSTFVSLIGANQLNVAVLMDVAAKDRQRVKNLQDNGHLDKKSLIEVSEFVTAADADIEDIFDPGFYLKLVNGAYDLSPKIKLADVKNKNPRIVKRLESHFEEQGIDGSRFNHYRPAAYLQREQGSLLTQLTAATTKRAADMFKRLNGLLG